MRVLQATVLEVEEQDRNVFGFERVQLERICRPTVSVGLSPGAELLSVRRLVRFQRPGHGVPRMG